MKTRMLWLSVLMSALLWSIMPFSPLAEAGDYPDRPITLMTAFNPGGGSDVSHRIIEKYAKDLIPQPFVIIYKPGAGGEFGWTELANAKPDGYYIGGIDLPHIVLQPMVRKKGQPGYQTEQLLPICGLVRDPNVVIVHKDSKWKTLKELMDYVRANPGKVTAATVGKFTGDHIFLMQFEFATGLKFVQVPYSGGGKAIPALMGKQVDCYFGSFNSYFRMESGRALGVATTERYDLDPNIPTLKEQGVDVLTIKRRGLAAPPNTPMERIKYLEERMRKMAEIPGYQEAVKKVGLSPSFLTAEEFAAYIKGEKAKAKEILTKIGFFKK
ncbi:MAG: tripartite tricarboxylate transporter substrate binding protein [Deltaproteobacteria bacterium]|nr:tripartite tricarboxylate transporter substrate binding protein [Deltaproteobacteria bacterium]MBW2305468.1 tripartite tricarboxylate transporter substrate binding protein [Deltaproteobacteria bacterium]